MTNRLKTIRKQNGDSLNDLKLKLENKGIIVSTGQLSSYENGKRSPRKMKIWEEIAKEYNVDLGYLLGVSDINTNKAIEMISEIPKDLQEYASNHDLSEKIKTTARAIDSCYDYENLKDLTLQICSKNNYSETEIESIEQLMNILRGTMVSLFDHQLELDKRFETKIIPKSK